MPTYSYRCPECMYEFVKGTTVEGRDVKQPCLRCAFSDLDVRCERIPDAPNFSVGGFSAKNGYSKSS